MAFLKALFGNSTDTQDESFALESLETPPSTVDLIRGKNTTTSTPLAQHQVMAAPMDIIATPTPVAPADPTPMDAQPTLIPVIPTIPTLTPVTPADPTPMDAQPTLIPVIPTGPIPTPVMPTDPTPMDAQPTLIPVIPASPTPTPVMPTDPTSMDAQPTLIPVIPTSPTLMDANTTSTPVISASIIPMNANTTPTATPADVIPMNANIPPSKVLLREVDESSNLRAQVYDLKKSVLKKDAQFTENFSLKDAGTSELEAQIRQRDVIITEQSQLLSQLRKGLDEVKQQTAAQNSVLAQVGSKDAVIAQQSEALQKLQRDLNEVRNQVVLETKAEIQWLQVDRESELLALNQKYETTLHKLQEGLNEEIETDEQRIRNLAHVRDLFKTVFDVTQDEDFLRCGGVSSQVAKAFIEGTGPGPDPSQLQWDFNNPASSAWNQAVISQLMCRLVEMRQKWTIKKRVDKAKPRINDNLSIETSVDIAKRLANEKDEALMKARRDMRRRTKYQRRKEIMENMVAVKEAKGDDNVVAWQFLSSVVAMLGSDGMSSEDSDGEDTETVYCTHMLPWRRDIVKELNLIDQRRLEDSSIFSPRGAKAAKRIRSDKFLQSEQKPVKGLPRPFYDAGWLAQNKEMCSDAPFRWMTIYAQS
ncbi:hypothetical protein EDC04DRAFT_2906986 [Pisolithus marmoratus]|nr:hypothetical protein EDC04DRAFT_2906986 [Pisolithus marmoratus]